MHYGVLENLVLGQGGEFGISGRKDCKSLVAIVCQAKNAILTRAGLTPEQAVFGRPLRWTGSTERDDEEVTLAALGVDGEVWKAAQIRSAATVPLLQRDASDKLRRVMMRQAPTVIGDVAPGTQIYFWSPHL